MFVATLLTDPARPALDPALVDSLRNAWGGGDAQWLAADEAAEFALERRPDNLAEVGATLRAQGVDLAFQPLENRRKTLLIADMDSTMIGQECIDELADCAGVGAHVAGITARAMNGELDFESALRERVGLLADLPISVIEEVLNTRITLTPGGAELLATMKAKGGYAALVSGGFTQFTARIAERLGFDENRANTLVVQGDRLTGQVGEPILGQQAKLDALHDITARLGITPDDVLAVGDGANDLAMINAAGMGVALHAKPAVAAKAAIRIDHGDLSALLFLQGYARDEFVTP
ncbi:phosphoserine phosphatase SerB [Oceaniglobus trochenteri]|uniref:phosphoserine phosphatase SerB n=1 Tax=Oceaniglobus trochenteri TaxID=2763260 RepID=UPI001CFF8288|nr:phosphoserine phosphatase SerB [Oceaniglobus trochenteri]